MDTMEARREAITKLVNERGTVSFGQLKAAFPTVSEMTLRTDLKYLDDAKKLLRIHGGAKSIEVAIGTDDFLNRKSMHNIREKQIIAEKACTLLCEDTCFYLDSGSTATLFARALPDRAHLIYTTGLSCATELTNLTKPTVTIPGGTLNRYSHSVSGIQTVKELERVSFDLAFIGVTGFHPQKGFSCGISDEALLKQTAMRQAERVVILMDTSKIGVKCSFSCGQLSDVDVIISDGQLPKDFLKACEEAGVSVL